MEVRRAEPGDEALWARAVASLVPPEDREDRLATTAEVATALRDPRCYLYLAFLADEPVGLLNAYRFPDVEAGGQIVYLYDIEVARDHRRVGAGAALVAALVRSCEEDGVRRVWAGTEVGNTAARRTFEATGAELEGDGYAEYEWDLED